MLQMDNLCLLACGCESNDRRERGKKKGQVNLQFISGIS